MKYYGQYKSLEHTLKSLIQQVRDSMPYIGNYIPKNINNPEELYYYLKKIVKYKNDPKNIEYIRTVQTLAENKWEGDCDCFTVLTIASSLYLGFNPEIVLVGKGLSHPTHIYAIVNGLPFDLTNSIYGYERPYKYKQILKIKV